MPSKTGKDFGGEAKIILRDRTDGRRVVDLGIDQPCGVRDA